MKKNKRSLNDNKNYKKEKRRIRFADRWTSNNKLSLIIFLISLTYFSLCLELKSISTDLRAIRRYILDDETIFQILRVLKNIDRRFENKLDSICRNIEDINFYVTWILSQLEHVMCVADEWARVWLVGRCVAGKLVAALAGIGRPWQSVVAVLTGLGKILATLV